MSLLLPLSLNLIREFSQSIRSPAISKLPITMHSLRTRLTACPGSLATNPNTAQSHLLCRSVVMEQTLRDMQVLVLGNTRATITLVILIKVLQQVMKVLQFGL